MPWFFARAGKLIFAVSEPDQGRANRHEVNFVEVTTDRLRRITELVDRGELKTHVGVVLSFADAREAHMKLRPSFSTIRRKFELK